MPYEYESPTWPPRRNEAMIREVVRHIEMMPHRWKQNEWCDPTHQCGTTFCFAGWAARIGGHVDDQGAPTAKGAALYAELEPERQCTCDMCHGLPSPRSISLNTQGTPYSDFWIRVGRHVLGLSEDEANVMFSGTYAYTVAELKRNLSAELGITFEEGADPHAV